MAYDYNNYVEQTYAADMFLSLDDFRRNKSFLFDRMSVCEGNRVLDVGGGSGEVSAVLADRGCVVTMLDVSEPNVAFARSVCRRVLTDVAFERLRLVVGDLTVSDGIRQCGFTDRQFDCVVCVDVWEHLSPKDCDALLQAFARLLSDNGRLYILTSPNRLMANLLLGFWRFAAGNKKGGLRDQGVHVNEQSYWSFRDAINRCAELQMRVEPIYFTGWLKGEFSVVLSQKPQFAWLKPAVCLVSKLHDLLYVIGVLCPWLRRMICRGFIAAGGRRQNGLPGK